MTSKKVLFFNGPKNSGKDYLTNYVCDHYHTAVPFMFKEKLIELLEVVYDLPVDWVNINYTRDFKDVPTNIFNGKSLRQALIHLAEEVIKPAYGKDYFGRCVVKYLSLWDNDPHSEVFVGSDCGFNEEVKPVIDHYGKENCYLVQILPEDYDTDVFKGDSRNWLDKDLFLVKNVFKFYNEKDGESHKTFIKDLMNLILKD